MRKWQQVYRDGNMGVVMDDIIITSMHDRWMLRCPLCGGSLWGHNELEPGSDWHSCIECGLEVQVIQDEPACRVTLVVPGSMNELIITHQKEDPWKKICPVCNGALGEFPDCDGSVSPGADVKEHHSTWNRCGLSFGWVEWLEVAE